MEQIFDMDDVPKYEPSTPTDAAILFDAFNIPNAPKKIQQQRTSKQPINSKVARRLFTEDQDLTTAIHMQRTRVRKLQAKLNEAEFVLYSMEKYV